jgi:hypothetical protein
MRYYITQKATVYSNTSLASEIVAELQPGYEIDVGEVIKDGDKGWHRTTLPNGKLGYISSTTKGRLVSDRISNPPQVSSPFLGLGVIASAIGFIILFTDDNNFGYRLGTALGQLLPCAILTLPVFIIWKYATQSGKVSSASKAFNVFFRYTCCHMVHALCGG